MNGCATLFRTEAKLVREHTGRFLSIGIEISAQYISVISSVVFFSISKALTLNDFCSNFRNKGDAQILRQSTSGTTPNRSVRSSAAYCLCIERNRFKWFQAKSAKQAQCHTLIERI